MNKPIILPFEFSSPTAKAFFECSRRNILWQSGYGAGKTYAACQKILALMMKFPGYRVMIGRFNATELKRTTVQTFFKVCPPALYDEKKGGKKIEGNPSYVELINGSRLYWMHLALEDQSALRSLEINAAVVDQAEEIDESVYLTLNVRVGRWDEVTVPQELLNLNPNWPINPMTGRPMAPAYLILLTNPPDEGEFSYLYQHFHPDSEYYKEYNSDTHAFFLSASGENKALPPEVLEMMMRNSPEWVDRYVLGNFGKGAGAIHSVPKESYIYLHTQEDLDWFEKIKKDSILSRAMDHGSDAPTACTWWANYKGNHICYREYYTPRKLISFHRQAISDLSGDEKYSFNIADPAIFKKTMQNQGGFWSVADEYSTSQISAPQLFWSPGDNNEFATRNRINELLYVNPKLTHIKTGKPGAPRIYYIRKSEIYSYGADRVVVETNSQKKKLLGEVNGEKVYSDDRDDKVVDHAYDTQRYYVAMHLNFNPLTTRKLKPRSFKAVQNRIKAVKKLNEYRER